jgi:hypothetical protein
VIALLDAGAPSDWHETETGTYPIHYALKHRNIAMLNAILAKYPGEITRVNNNDKKTPIQLAASLGFWDVATAIAKKCRTASTDEAKYGYVLLSAARANQTDAVIALLDAGAPSDWHETETGTYPIHYAVKHRNIAMLNAILAKYPGESTRVNKANKQTPIQLAESLAYLDVIEAIDPMKHRITRGETAGRSEISSEAVSKHADLLSAFMKEMHRINELRDDANKILQLQLDLEKQISALNLEIKTEDDDSSKLPNFFKKVSRELDGSTKKEEERRVLIAALKLMDDKINSAHPTIQAASLAAFNASLTATENLRWKDAVRSKRTQELVERTLLLLNKQFVKPHEQSIVVQESAAAASPSHQAARAPQLESSAILGGLFASTAIAAAAEERRLHEEAAHLQATLNALTVSQQPIEKGEVQQDGETSRFVAA